MWNYRASLEPRDLSRSVATLAYRKHRQVGTPDPPCIAVSKTTEPESGRGLKEKTKQEKSVGVKWPGAACGDLCMRPGRSVRGGSQRPVNICAPLVIPRLVTKHLDPCLLTTSLWSSIALCLTLLSLRHFLALGKTARSPSYPPPPLQHTHTRARAHTHARTHARTHTHTHAHARTLAHFSKILYQKSDSIRRARNSMELKGGALANTL